MRFNNRVFVFVAALLVLLAPATPAYALTSKEIQRELMCQCGCTMVVDVCDCETANQIRTKITELMGQGQGKTQIVDYFISQYGEKMLASPSKKGFNLVAWILPFVVVIAGSVALFFILRIWVLKGRNGVNAAVTMLQPVTSQETEEYRGRLEEELKIYKEEGSV